MPANKTTYKCGTCGLGLGKTTGRVSCKSCGIWYHSECVKVPDSTLKTLKEVKSVYFICEKCADAPGSSSELFNMETRLRDEIVGINNKIENLIQRKEDDLNDIKKAFSDAMSEFKTEMLSFRKELQSDIINCSKLIKHVDSSTSSKIAALEDENNLLHKRINRADIVVNGLPSGLDDLCDVAVKIFAHYNIIISKNDIYHVCYMYNHKSILIKLNSVILRDSLMNEYYKTRMLKIGDVLDNEIDHRVYLNDHFSPAAGRLNSLCRRLLRLKIISKFKILNMDKLKVKVTMPDGVESIYSTKECAALLDGDGIQV